MARTRGQDKREAHAVDGGRPETAVKRRATTAAAKERGYKRSATTSDERNVADEQQKLLYPQNASVAKEPSSKRRKGGTGTDADAKHVHVPEVPAANNPGKAGMTENHKEIVEAKERKAIQTGNEKLDSLVSEYGTIPLSSTALSDPSTATPSTILAHIIHAMLTSARISHHLASKSVHLLLEEGYSDLATLTASTWERRTEVLTEGGYTHYREKTATQLGDLAAFVNDKYDGDLNNLRKQAKDDPKQIRKLVKEIKGIGEVGCDIFLDTVQGVWECCAPFVDPRSMKILEKDLEIKGGVDKVWELVDRDAMDMARVCTALTTIRLEGKVNEIGK